MSKIARLVIWICSKLTKREIEQITAIDLISISQKISLGKMVSTYEFVPYIKNIKIKFG